MKKRFTSMILMLCMIFTLFPSTTFAQGITGSPVTLQVNSSTANDNAIRSEGAVYKTIAGALNKAESGDTIQLTSDITEIVETQANSNDYTIDMNGKTWNATLGGTAIKYRGNGTIRIIDTSTNGTGLITGNSGVILNLSSGTIQLDGVTVTGNYKVILNESTGTIQLEGVTANGEYQIIENKSSGVININSGTIIANNDADPFAVSNLSTGIVNINSDINGIIFNGGGITNITGGFIHSAIANLVVQNNNNGTLNITGAVISSPNKTAILNYATINTFKDCILLGKTEGADAPDGWKVYGNATLNSNAEIPEGKNLKIPADATLTIPDGVTLTNKGIINNSAGGTIHGMNNIKNIEDGVMIDLIGANTVSASLDLENVTTDVKCTDSDVANKITGMTTHNHEDGIPCWKWNYATKTLALHNFDFSLVSEKENFYGMGIKLPGDNVTIVFDGNNTIVNKFGYSIIKDDGDITFTGTSSIAKLDVKAKYIGIVSFNGYLHVNEGIINVQGSRGLDGKNINVYGGNIYVASQGAALDADNISFYGGTITGKSNGLTDSPFTVEPTLSDNMTHKADTGTWDNTLGEACTYEEEVIDVTGISLNKHTTTLYSDADPKTETLQATIQPSNATNKDVTWTSSAPSIATVENGVVTALKPGTTTITATTVDGEKTATCVVTVTQQAVLQHTINATAGIGGTISPSGAIKVGTGENKTFTIQAEEGYRIASVKVNGVEQGAIDTYTFTNVKGDHTIFATFREEGQEPEDTYTYKIIDGANAVWKNTSSSPLVFKIDGDYDKFSAVEVDGNLVDKVNYTVEKGSTIIHLKSEYLKTLGMGNHKIEVLFEGFEATTNFTIKEAQVVKNETTTTKKEESSKILKETSAQAKRGVSAIMMLVLLGGIVYVSTKRKVEK